MHENVNQRVVVSIEVEIRITKGVGWGKSNILTAQKKNIPLKKPAEITFEKNQTALSRYFPLLNTRINRIWAIRRIAVKIVIRDEKAISESKGISFLGNALIDAIKLVIE